MSQWDWWVGIDLGSEKHEACILDCRGEVQKRFRFGHDPQGLAHFVEVLEAMVGGRYETVAAALENNHGMVCDILVERGVAVHSINPKQLDRFRDRYNMAGAKDDALDARVLADSLRTDTRLYHRVELLPEVNLRVRELSRTLDEQETVFRQQANRLWSQLSRYFPVLLKFCSGADEPWLWALLKVAGTPDKMARLSEKRIGAILKQFQIRRFSAAELSAAVKADGLRGGPLVAELCEERIGLYLKQLTMLHRQIATLEKKIREIMEPEKKTRRKSARSVESTPESSTPGNPSGCSRSESEGNVETGGTSGTPLTDREIVISTKGIGWKTGAALLGEAAQAIRHADLDSLRGASGVAPVTRRSGKSCYTAMRRACNHRLREAMHHAAGVAYQHVEPWGKIYTRIRSRGGSHARALRQVGDRMLDVLCAMLRDRTLFDITRLNGKSFATCELSGTPR